MNPLAFQPVPFRPRRLASWWSRLPDLLWPEPRVRDAIQRRADRLAAAGVDTVIQFGFHCRFDFAPYFSLLHGYLADVAQALHERHMRFFDHYSCNVVARPRTREELARYHRFQRHHVAIHPDSIAAETLGYAGHRFNDLREVDVETGEPTYTSAYQCELFCHTNPEFRAMHEAYLRRHLAEIPADGFQIDDMARYAYLRGCACCHCREQFAREFGRELPPFEDKLFWGDTSQPPSAWGNYANPVFRDWILMRYRTHADHLARIRRVIGPDRMLLTCCSASGPSCLNAMGLSYEHFIASCDWVMLENCGLGADTVSWSRIEPEALLHKGVAETKSPTSPAPAVALSYTVFADGAYLGWAIARFWGVSNWISTLVQGSEDDPEPLPEEADLIAPLNHWEQAHELPEGRDVVDARVVFLRTAKEDGWCDPQGRDHWTRVRRWADALLQQNVGCRFVLADELADVARLVAETTLLILDGCPVLAPSQRDALAAFARAGGQLVLVPPVDAELAGPRVAVLEADTGPTTVTESVSRGLLRQRLRWVSGDANWRLRLRVHGDRLVLHLLNSALEGIEHPSIMDRWTERTVLHTFRSQARDEPLVVEFDATGLPWDWSTPALFSPELSAPRPVNVDALGSSRFRLTLDLRGIRLYADARETRRPATGTSTVRGRTPDAGLAAHRRD